MNKKKVLKLILALTGLAILTITIFLFYYLNKNYNVSLFCLIYEVTGLYCPGCGMTRAVISLLNLDFYQAFRYNIFAIFLLPLLTVYFFSEVYCWIFEKENILFSKIPEWFWVFIFISMIIFGILRNFPIFSFLAPTKI